MLQLPCLLFLLVLLLHLIPPFHGRREGPLQQIPSLLPSIFPLPPYLPPYLPTSPLILIGIGKNGLGWDGVSWRVVPWCVITPLLILLVVLEVNQLINQSIN